MNKKLIASLLFCLLFACFIAACASKVEKQDGQAADTQAADTQQVETQEPEPDVTATFYTDASAVTCADAEGYARKGDYDLARSAYTSIATSTPGAKCALQGLIMVDEMEKGEETPPEPTPGYEDIVPALLNNGDYAGAWDKLKEGVAANPDSTLKTNVWLWLWKAWNYLKNLTTDILIPLAMAVFIILLIFPLMKIIIPRKRKMTIDIADFKPGSANEVDEKMCLSVSNKVQENLFSYYKKRLVSDCTIVNCPVNPPDLPDSISAKASGIWNFLIKLYPTQIMTVSGIMENHKDKGVGIALSITSNTNQKVMEHITFWYSEQYLPTPEPETKTLLEKLFGIKKAKTPEQPKSFNKDQYYEMARQLAMVAAAWVYWQYCLLEAKGRIKEIFGTDNFESYKWWLVYRYQLQIIKNGSLKEKREKARPYLEKSLEADRSNTIVQLVYCQYYLDPKKDAQNRDPYEKKLQLIIENGKETDLTTVMAHYSLGDLYLNERLKLHPSMTQIDAKDRRVCFEEQFKPAFDGALRERGINEEVRRYLQIPYLLEFVLSGQVDRAKRELEKIEKLRSSNSELLYNLACLYSVLSTCEKCPSDFQADLCRQFYPPSKYWEINKPGNFKDMALVNLEKAIFHSCFADKDEAKEYYEMCETDEWLKTVITDNAVYQNIKTKYAGSNKDTPAADSSGQKK